MLKKLSRHPAVQATLARLVAGWLSFALRTTRWTVEGDDTIRDLACTGHVVVAFWHEALPLMPQLFRHARRHRPDLRTSALASRHSDGRLLGGILAAFGIGVVHGSSRRDGRERGGAAGTLALLDGLEHGIVAAITPDGPRGPRRRAAPGVAQLAGLSGAPVLAFGAMTRHHIRLPTWDRLVLPLPFGRGAIVCGAPIAVPREGWEAQLPQIEAGITAATLRAEALCR